MKIRAVVLAAVLLAAACGSSPPAPPTHTTASAPPPVSTTAPASAAALTLLQYRVTGGSTASITWTDARGQTRQDTSATLPWRQTYLPDTGGGYAGAGIYMVWAQDMSGTGGGIGCEIWLNGQRLTANQSSGAYAVVTCQATI